MTLLVLATIVANYHSHAYGAAMVAVPLAEAITEWHPSWFTRVAIGAALIVPTLLLTLVSFENLPQATRVFTLLLLLCYGSLLIELWWRGRDRSATDRTTLSGREDHSQSGRKLAVPEIIQGA
jgi:hypothetical protein